jgi:hypothetical protein
VKNRRSRPLGIRVIAVILFLESAILLLSAFASLWLSGAQVEQIEAFFGTIPYFKRLPLANDTPSIVFAGLWGTWAALKGLGIWFMWSWVRILILLDLAGRFGDFILATAIMDHKQQSELLHNPDFVVGFVVNLLVLLYLADSGVEREFEKS